MFLTLSYVDFHPQKFQLPSHLLVTSSYIRIRRPAARRQHAPRTWTPGRPPRRPADKAHTTTRTPQPEVGPRPRPGNFRCCSRRAGALGDLYFRPGAGRGKRESAVVVASQPAPACGAGLQRLRPGTSERGLSPSVNSYEGLNFR